MDDVTGVLVESVERKRWCRLRCKLSRASLAGDRRRRQQNRGALVPSRGDKKLQPILSRIGRPTTHAFRDGKVVG